MVGGGDLASIHSKEENNFIQTLMKDDLVWLSKLCPSSILTIINMKEEEI